MFCPDFLIFLIPRRGIYNFRLISQKIVVLSNIVGYVPSLYGAAGVPSPGGRVAERSEVGRGTAAEQNIETSLYYGNHPALPPVFLFRHRLTAATPSPRGKVYRWQYNDRWKIPSGKPGGVSLN